MSCPATPTATTVWPAKSCWTKFLFPPIISIASGANWIPTRPPWLTRQNWRLSWARTGDSPPAHNPRLGSGSTPARSPRLGGGSTWSCWEWAQMAILPRSSPARLRFMSRPAGWWRITWKNWARGASRSRPSPSTALLTSPLSSPAEVRPSGCGRFWRVRTSRMSCRRRSSGQPTVACGGW